MTFIETLKKNIWTILIIIAVVAAWTTLYDQFFSGKAKLIREYKAQIKEHQDRIQHLTTEYTKLNEEEKMRIDMIESLKNKLEELKTSINNNETTLEEIKDETLDIETALQELENHTRGSLSRGKAVLESSPAGPGK